MLVLSRKFSEEIIIDGPCTIRVVDLTQHRVKLGITAGETTDIRRAELKPCPDCGHYVSPERERCKRCESKSLASTIRKR